MSSHSGDDREVDMGSDEGPRTEGTIDDDPYAGATYRDDATVDDGDGWLGRSAAGLLVVLGLVLVFIPEPATSTVGAAMVLAGVVVWVLDALS